MEPLWPTASAGLSSLTHKGQGIKWLKRKEEGNLDVELARRPERAMRHYRKCRI